MWVEVVCKEIGGECDFVAGGESEEEILYALMRHIQDEHADDWFSVEEFYSAARALVHVKVA